MDIYEWPFEQYTISTDPERLDLDLVHEFLSKESYWATGRTRDTVERSVTSSLNFGAYEPDGTMVGAARVVTDWITFAWLCDVFVVEPHRGNGLGVALVEAVVSHPALREVKRLVLATGDSHGLYERFGFEQLGDEADRWMVRIGAID
jgi:GNAT superfamily N-acetyltransferase